MADRTISVRLRVEDSFSQPINNYTAKMSQAERATQQMSQGATRAQSAFNGMGHALTGAVAAFGVMGVMRLGEELYQTGMNAQRAGMLFRSFGSQVGDTTILLEELRRVTRGAVDDVSLMDGASRLLSMGIAKNADDVEHLTSIAATFAQAMGTDVAGALEQVSLIISNESYLRLDSLGIGSGQVRELTNQYKAAGMASSEAFAQAFMDIADQKMPQMAAVADATVTELQKMQASVENWWDDFGERFAMGVNGLIGMVKHLGDILGIVLDAVPGGGDIPTGVGPTMGDGGMTADGRPTTAVIAQMIRMQLNNGNYAYFNDPMFQGERGFTMGQYAPPPAMSIAQLMNGTLSNADFDAARDARFRSQWGGAYAGMSEGGQWQEMQAARMRKLWSDYSAAQMEMQGLGSYFAGGGIATPAEVDRAGQLLETVMQLRDVAKAIGTDDQAAIWDRMYDAAAGMAEQVGAAADRLKDMSLSQLFGQTGGGRLGEIDQAVLTSLQAGGAPQETIDALARAMGLDSGQITQMSVQFEDQVVPLLEDVAAQMGGSAYNAMRRRYDEAVANAAMTGAPTIDMASLMGGFAYYPGGGGPAGSYTVQAGDTASAIAARFGVGVGDFGLANPSLIMPGQQLTWGSAGGGGLINTDFDPLEQSMLQAGGVVATAVEDAATITDEMTTAVDTLAAGIEGVFGKTYQLPIELVVKGTGILAQMIAEAVNANGGKTPGETPFQGKSRKSP